MAKAKTSKPKTKLTPADAHSYVQDDGLHCPYCGSDDIMPTSTVHSGKVNPTPRVDIKCDCCGKKWTDLYHLAGVEVDQDGDTAFWLFPDKK